MVLLIFIQLLCLFTNNNSIMDNNIFNNSFGISLWLSEYNTIRNNTIYNNIYGMELEYSKYDTIRNN